MAEEDTRALRMVIVFFRAPRVCPVTGEKSKPIRRFRPTKKTLTAPFWFNSDMIIFRAFDYPMQSYGER